MSIPDSDQSRASWLSRGFEQLRFDYEQGPPPPFDVLIVGSGYGGAIAAETLSQYETTENGVTRKLRIGVLERGQEYLPGAFPANSTELPGHLRGGPKKEGLFDIRRGPDVGAIVGSGVGGGSLINAGVMLRPDASVFERRWPQALTENGVLDKWFDRCELLLGSSRVVNGGIQPNTMPDDGDGNSLKKYEALQRLDPANTTLASITVAVEDTVNSGNVELNECRRCADCATGCNHGSKDSLDTNLLRRAFLRGVLIYSGATVLRVAFDTNNSLYRVFTVHTESRLRRRQRIPLEIRARHVILAAGTFGSVEILHRSREDLNVSRMLGRRCSTNGDTIITHFDTGKPVNAVANESDAPDSPNRRIGSTINGVLDLRGYTGSGENTVGELVIEEMAVPGHLRRLFAEIYTTSNLIHNLATLDCTRHVDDVAVDDLFEVDDDKIRNTGLYAVMGDDGAEGSIEFVDDDGVAYESSIPDSADGVARMAYTKIADHPLFDREVDAFRHLAETRGLDGQVIPNPAWRIVPDTISTIADTGRGPVVTVHPLGGCVMADHSSDGVVNQHGLVFDGDDTSEIHEGLAVLDGSIIPSALSANPALTISAVALRASVELAENRWGYTAGDYAWSPPVDEAADPPQSPADEIVAEFPEVETKAVRKDTRKVKYGFDPDPTEVRVTERMSGAVRLKNSAGVIQDLVIELTLRTQPIALRGLSHPRKFPGGHVFPIDTSQDDTVVQSRLRVFKREPYEELMEQECDAYEMERKLDEITEWSSYVDDGSKLIVLEQEASRSWWRTLRGMAAYAYNNGLRDLWQRFTDRDNRRATNISVSGFIDGVRGLIALASRAGECRTMVYRINLEKPFSDFIGSGNGRTVVGRKRFTYSCRGNPWTQLSSMRFVELPGRMPWREWLRLEKPPRIELETKFLARIRVPLIEITAESDGVTALGDMASLLAYIARMTLGIHTWSFRAPDTAKEYREPDYLPRHLDGVTAPEIHHVNLGEEIPHWDTVHFGDDAAPVRAKARLARYRPAHSTGLPLLMIHGYSASGTSFAHNSIDDCYAKHFFDQGRDVWVADLRSSCGMPTARKGWSFEQMAYRDIPEIVEIICDETGEEKIDVIAHCMGAAMFGMGMLHGADLQDYYEKFNNRRQVPVETATEITNGRALRLLPGRINSAVFSQVSSTVVLSPDNIFRGYVAKSFRQFLPDHYEFNPGPNPGVADRLLDRVLATLPYPENEFRRENPLRPCARTPWTRTRHRMDALYGRVFNLKHMTDEVLEHIDDFFGPLSIDTVSQTIEFARYRMITNVDGINKTVGRRLIAEAWKNKPLLMINARQNGLADGATCSRTAKIFGDAGITVTEALIGPAGHQDCLIGTTSRKRALAKIDEFFDSQSTSVESRQPNEDLVAYPPWIGPVLQTDETNHVGDTLTSFRVGSRPDHINALGVMLTRIHFDRLSGAIRKPDGEAWARTDDDKDLLIDSSVMIRSSELKKDGWVKLYLPPPDSTQSPVTGNAWLVLLLYDESQALGDHEYIYLRTSGRGFSGSLRQFDPHGDFQASAIVTSTPGTPKTPMTARGPLTAPLEISAREFDTAWTAALDFVADRTHAEPPAAPDLSAKDVAPSGKVLRNAVERAVSPLIGDTALDRLVTDSTRAHNGVIPDPEDYPGESSETSFLLTSCQYPAAFFDQAVAYQGYAEALQRVESAASGDATNGIVPRFAILAGDQIYADATAGLYDPTIREGRFELPYQQWLRFPTVRGLLRQLPSYMLLDDHEIADNWEPFLNEQGQRDKKNDKLRNEGFLAYENYQRGRNVDLPFGFAENGHRFTLFDTRSERRIRGTLSETLTNVVNGQYATLSGVETVRGGDVSRPIYVVTPSMLLPRHRSSIAWDCPESATRSDGWDGYPMSLFDLLARIVNDQITNIVFLSGDEHLACYAKIELARSDGSDARTFYSIHAAPAFAPYPFANSRSDLHASSETIHFSVDPGAGTFEATSSLATGEEPANPAAYDYRCSVTTIYPDAAQGMTYLRSYTAGGGRWSIDIEFPGVANLVTIADIAA